MKNNLKILTFLILIFLGGCKEDDELNDSVNTNSYESFNCIDGDCMNVGSNGIYSSLSDCQGACGSVLSTITDTRDGQTYETVTIGSQIWFAENLRYSDNIPHVIGDQGWNADYDTQQPAWSYHNDNPANNAIYGKLYNGYAVETGSLCPPGWHIPTEDEWTVLIDYLGGESIAGGKMKTTTDWDAPNMDATNSSGFSGLPGGARVTNGSSNGIGINGNWWSSTEFSYLGLKTYNLNYRFGSVEIESYAKHIGISCRCLMD